MTSPTRPPTSSLQTDIIDSVQVSDPGSAVVVLYDLELPNGGMAYFTPSNDTNFESLRFRDFKFERINTYEPIPIEAEGFDISTSGAYDRPLLRVANISDTFLQKIGGLEYEDLIGQKLTKRITLQKYLVGESDDVSGGPPIEFPRTVFILDRIKSKNIVVVEFELAAPFDLPNILVPRRSILGGKCPWVYKGAQDGIPQHLKRGGCSWDPEAPTYTKAMLPNGSTLQGGYNPVESEEANTEFPLYMSKNDEYIVARNAIMCHELLYIIDSNIIKGFIHADDDDHILISDNLMKQGMYFKTNYVATKIAEDGRGRTEETVPRYYQLLRDINAGDTVEGPITDKSNNTWREVRVYTDYVPQTTYSGYEDSRLNDYVRVPISKPLIGIDITQALSVHDPEGITPNSKYINLKEFGITNTNFSVEGLTRSELKTDVDGHGAISGSTYSIYEDESVLLMYLQIFPDTHSYDTYESIYYPSTLEIKTYSGYASSEPCKLRRVKFASVEVQTPENEFFTNPVTGRKWVEGDICGKNVASCRLRFQYKIDDFGDTGKLTTGAFVPFSTVNTGSSTVAHVSGTKLGCIVIPADVYAALDEKSVVTLLRNELRIDNVSGSFLDQASAFEGQQLFFDKAHLATGDGAFPDLNYYHDVVNGGNFSENASFTGGGGIFDQFFLGYYQAQIVARNSQDPGEGIGGNSSSTNVHSYGINDTFYAIVNEIASFALETDDTLNFFAGGVQYYHMDTYRNNVNRNGNIYDAVQLEAHKVGNNTVQLFYSYKGQQIAAGFPDSPERAFVRYHTGTKITHKFFMTDTHINSGHDGILAFKKKVFNEDVRVGVDLEDTISLPFGGFPGSRKFS